MSVDPGQKGQATADSATRKGSRYRGEAAWIIAGRAVNLAAAVLSLKLLTTLLSVEEYGRFGLVLAAANAGALLFFAPFGSGVLRFTHPLAEAGDAATLRKIFHRYLFGLSGALVVAGALAALVAPQVMESASAKIVLLATFLLVLLGMQIATFNAVQAMRNRRSAAVFQGMLGFSRGLVAAPFVWFFAPSAEWALFGTVVFLSVHVSVQYLFVEKTIVGGAATRQVPADAGRDPNFGSRGFLRFCLPFVVIFGLTMLSRYSDRFLAAGALSLAEVGVLVAFLQIGWSVSMLATEVSAQFAFPILFAGRSAGKDRQRKRRLIIANWATVMLFVGVVSAIVAFFAEPLVRLLTTPDYVAHASLLPLLVFASALPSAARLLEAEGMIANRTWQYIWPKLGETLALLAILLLTLPVLGVYAVPLAYFGSGLLLTVGYFLQNAALARNMEDKQSG